MGLSGAFSSMLGAYVASLIGGNVLKIVFGSVVIVGSLRMLTAKLPEVQEKPIDKILPYVFWGIVIGFFCGFIGIGGGVLIVPVMVLALKFDIHKAIGTSTAVMIFTSIGGVISYIVNGLNASGLPPYSLGYVNILQWMCLAGTSIPMAQLGVKVAHKLPSKQLKYIFAVVKIYMGLR